MQSGELIVTGKNNVRIRLEGFPSLIEVAFKGEECEVPCNPHHVDSLEYEVHASNTVRSGFVLVIKWSVTNVREIKWQASY
jgi:hypothetical protein